MRTQGPIRSTFNQKLRSVPRFHSNRNGSRLLISHRAPSAVEDRRQRAKARRERRADAVFARNIPNLFKAVNQMVGASRKKPRRAGRSSCHAEHKVSGRPWTNWQTGQGCPPPAKRPRRKGRSRSLDLSYHERRHPHACRASMPPRRRPAIRWSPPSPRRPSGATGPAGRSAARRASAQCSSPCPRTSRRPS